MKAQLKMGSDRESRKRAWEENELSSLAKAIVKFPAGSQNRELAYSGPVGWWRSPGGCFCFVHFCVVLLVMVLRTPTCAVN